MEKVSIIMPAYNSNKTIQRAIDSVINQTYKNIELIIINDGSIDNTNEIINKNCLEDSRIKKFEIQNSGSAVARNIGLDNASGDYIGFVDSDDEIEIDMIEKLISIATEFNTDIVSCSFKWVYPKNTIPEKTLLRSGYFSKQNLIEEIYPYIFSTESFEDYIPKTMWTKLFKKELIMDNEIRFVPELKMSQDIIFSITAFLNSNSFYYLPSEKLYNYIMNVNSRTNTYLKNGWSILKSNYYQLENLSKAFPKIYGLEKQLPYALLRNVMTAIANEGRNKNANLKIIGQNIHEIVNDDEVQQSLQYVEIKNIHYIRLVILYLIKWKQTKLLTLLTSFYKK
ncbi:hypothetical protein CJ191_01950 [Aerococcus viridans]|uniref:Glycosyltransferase 2-like domain-containing protein n=1 Tax=Aerococcus viridans TaxID=1377 RepID=A0A2N6UFL8_9LACT|nr:glycosyltransferase [Aerococcus viridans]PMC80347.1 hypothetical protein CJ191_01950 [Aerococcus viridans]